MTDLQISSPEIELTGAMRAAIQEQAGGLEAHAGPGRRLHACHVAVARPAGPGRAHPYQVRVRVSMPDHELNATHDEHANFYVALTRAFENLRRQLHALDGRHPRSAAVRADQVHP